MDEKKLFKHPFVACEVLSAEVPQITDCFFKKPKKMNEEEDMTQMEEETPDYSLLEKLWSFLDGKTSGECYETLAGYFTKSLVGINNVRGQSLHEFLFKKEKVNQLLERLEKHSIASLLSSFLVIEAHFKTESSQGNFKEERKAVLVKLVGVLCGKEKPPFNELENISFVFNELFAKSSSVLNGLELIRDTFTTSTIEKLLLAAAEEGKRERSEVILTLLSKLIDYSEGLVRQHPVSLSFPNTFEERDPDTQNEAKNEEKRLKKEISAAACKILPKFLEFVHKELVKEKNEEVSFQFRQPVRVLGNFILKFFVFVSHLIPLDAEVSAVLIQNEFLTLVIRLIEKHEWNSILHSCLLKTLAILQQMNEESLNKYVGSST